MAEYVVTIETLTGKFNSKLIGAQHILSGAVISGNTVMSGNLGSGQVGSINHFSNPTYFSAVISNYYYGNGNASVVIYGNAAVTDATERSIFLNVLDATNNVWRTMITLLAMGATPAISFNSRPISNMVMGADIDAGGYGMSNAGSFVFATGGAVQSGTTATNTFLLQAYDTTTAAYVTFGTLTSGITATRAFTLANITMSGTWIASGTVTLPAVTLGGIVTGDNYALNNLGHIGLGNNASVNTIGIYFIQTIASASTLYSAFCQLTNTAPGNCWGITSDAINATGTSGAQTYIGLIGRGYRTTVSSAALSGDLTAPALVGVEGNAYDDCDSGNAVDTVAALHAATWGKTRAGAGALVNAIGLLINNLQVTGTVTNAYGIYIQAISGAATTNRAIYVAGGISEFDGIIQADGGITLPASFKLNPTSGVGGFSVVSTALTLGSLGSVVIPQSAANATDALAGNVAGAIAIDTTGTAERLYFRGASWFYIAKTGGLSMTAQERIDPTGHKFELGDVIQLIVDKINIDGSFHAVPYFPGGRNQP